MFCQQCNRELKDGAQFCTHCGARQQPVAVDPDKTVAIFSENPIPQPAAPVQEPVTVPPVAPVVPQPAPQPVQQVAPQPEQLYHQPVQRPARQAVTTAPQPVQAPVVAGAAHNGSVGFGQAVSLFFKNYVNFKGRASRSEFWWVFLFNVLMYVPLGLISAALPPLGGACTVALMIPGISLAVRRLHDVGKSGWYYFMGLIPLVGGIILLIYFLKPSEGNNQFGPGPADAVAPQAVSAPVNAPAAKKAVTDQDIYMMAKNHAPRDLNTPDAKHMMDAALHQIIPTYSGIENLAGVAMLCDPQSIKASIAAADTDTLLVIFKALGYHIGRGADGSILGLIQNNVLTTLKSRF